MEVQKTGYVAWFTGPLALLFITLKLMGYITWSWWWVLSPVWLPLGIVIVLCALAGLLVVVADLISK